MIRIIFAAIIIYIIWRLWQKAPHKRKPSADKQSELPGEMVACDRCGTFILDTEAIRKGGRIYCSEGCWKGN
ncbi:MAG: hypothetical protein HN337_05205 [Deltaproteobacteria bacterium]|nr:hypothetical protein [Deltaproteobacteria bacterium]